MFNVKRNACLNRFYPFPFLAGNGPYVPKRAFVSNLNPQINRMSEFKTKI